MLSADQEQRLRNDIATARYVTQSVTYAGTDKNQLADDIEAALTEIATLKARAEAAVKRVEEQSAASCTLLQDYLNQRDTFARQLKAAREALVEAAIPLEALVISETVRYLAPETREGIHNAIKCIRAALPNASDASAPVSNWISVAELLPYDDSEYVWWHAKNGHIFHDSLINTLASECTHWMPAPTPAPPAVTSA